MCSGVGEIESQFLRGKGGDFDPIEKTVMGKVLSGKPERHFGHRPPSPSPPAGQEFTCH